VAKAGDKLMATNNNYRRGANLERSVKKWYESQGYIASRSAGSHGAADVWATNFKELVFVQCKIGADAKRCEKILKELADELLNGTTAVDIHTVLSVVVGMKNGEPEVLAERHVKQAHKVAKKSRASVPKV
jgi:hypothetical protein